jgi:hypothetical protein
MVKIYFEQVSAFCQSLGSMLGPIVWHLVCQVVLEVEPTLLRKLSVLVLKYDIIVRREAFDGK